MNREYKILKNNIGDFFIIFEGKRSITTSYNSKYILLSGDISMLFVTNGSIKNVEVKSESIGIIINVSLVHGWILNSTLVEIYLNNSIITSNVNLEDMEEEVDSEDDEIRQEVSSIVDDVKALIAEMR